MNKSRGFNYGFTLVEMLVGMAIMGILLLAFTQVFGGSLRASGQINGRNELISEGQIAQQLIASRLQSAYFIYPPGTTLQMTSSGFPAKNTVRPSGVQNWQWTVGTDPIVAVIVPPRILGQCPTTAASPLDKAACFTFYAYYPVLRSVLTGGTDQRSAPDEDPQNDDVWMLMEYRTNLLDGVDRRSVATCPDGTTGQGYLACPPNTTSILSSAATPNIRGNPARILTDYVQPTNAVGQPAYTMFRTCVPSNPSPNGCPAGTPATDPSWTELSLRLLQRRGGRALTAPSGNAVLTTRVYPRNWF